MASSIVKVDPTAEYLTVVMNTDGKQETYSLLEKPPFTAALVTQAESEILQTLSIEKVVLNLKNTGDLMYLAYNALSGVPNIQVKMSDLQRKFYDACSVCVRTAQNFVTKSDDVIDQIITSYNYLYQLEEAAAAEYLANCGETAKELADEARALASRFKTIMADCAVVHNESLELRNLKNEEREKLKHDLDELKAVQANAETYQKEIKAALEQINIEYEEAKRIEQTEAQRAFDLGLASTIIGGIASAFGAGVQMFVASKTMGLAGGMGGAAPQPSAPQSPVIQKTDASIAELEKATKKKVQLQRDQNKVAQEIVDANKNLQAQTDPAAKQKAEDLLKQKQAESQKLDAQLAAATEAVKGLQASADRVSQDLKQMSSTAQTALERASAQKLNLFNARNKMAEDNRKTLAQLQEYAVRVSNTKISIDNSAMAIESLSCAVRALAQAYVALTETALFWDSMADFCQRLQTPAAQKQLATNMKMQSEEKRRKAYSQPLFMKAALDLLCKWTAVNSVCRKYLTTSNEVFNKVGTNIASSPSIEQGQKQAPVIAKSVLTNLDAELKIIDAQAGLLPPAA